MKKLRLIFPLVLLLGGAALRAQTGPKSVDISGDVEPLGGATLVYTFAYDASGWAAWKSMIGNDPARVRAFVRYLSGAEVSIDDFKFDRDDLNRVAKMTVHTSTMARLRDDGRYSLPIDSGFRLINNTGRLWFFSGSFVGSTTPATLKVTLPAEAAGATLIDVGTNEQSLAYTLPHHHGSAHRYVIIGWSLLVFGALLVGYGRFFSTDKRQAGNSPPQAPGT